MRGGEWENIDLFTAISEAVGEEVTVETSREKLEALAEAHDINVAPFWVPGKIAEEIFEELVGSKLWAPTFVRDFPVETSPLTRPHRSKPGVTEKWDLYVRGMELGTAYSELADPVIQRERLVAERLHARGVDAAAASWDAWNASSWDSHGPTTTSSGETPAGTFANDSSTSPTLPGAM